MIQKKCTMFQKNQYTWLLIITSANIDFLNSFTDRFPRKFWLWQGLPSHLNCVATLHCETWKLQLLTISIAYCMWDLRIHLDRYEATLTVKAESYDYKIWKSMQQCSEEHPWCQRIEALDGWIVTWAAAIVTDEAHTSEWRKCLRTYVCTRDGHFQRFL